jgi:hypothetical protein
MLAPFHDLKAFDFTGDQGFSRGRGRGGRGGQRGGPRGGQTNGGVCVDACPMNLCMCGTYVSAFEAAASAVAVVGVDIEASS